MTLTHIEEIQESIYQTALKKGWYGADPENPQERNFGEVVALMHSELSEALEAHRAGDPALYYGSVNDVGLAKPEGWATELVDCMIRIMDCLEANHIDITTVINLKMEYNKTRPVRHGGKKY